jgi:hypothetical protein
MRESGGLKLTHYRAGPLLTRPLPVRSPAAAASRRGGGPRLGSRREAARR